MVSEFGDHRLMGGMLPAGLLCAVAGMMLAFVPLRQALQGAALLTVLAFAATAVPVAAGLTGAVFAGCWASLLACALCIYWRRAPLPILVVGLAANAGLWAGLVVAADAGTARTGFAIPAVLLGVPAAWCVRKGYAIVPRIVTSWLLAVAMIAAVLPHAVSHPGYVPDHMQ